MPKSMTNCISQLTGVIAALSAAKKLSAKKEQTSPASSSTEQTANDTASTTATATETVPSESNDTTAE